MSCKSRQSINQVQVGHRVASWPDYAQSNEPERAFAYSQMQQDSEAGVQPATWTPKVARGMGWGLVSTMLRGESFVLKALWSCSRVQSGREIH